MTQTPYYSKLRAVVEAKGPTAAWEIYHSPFRCIIRKSFLLSGDAMVEEFGFPCSDNKLLRDHEASEVVEIAIPVAVMAEYFEQGANIELVNSRDGKRIYQLIAKHLTDWDRYVMGSLNNTEVPADDLRTLDEMAALLYPLSKRTYEDEAVAAPSTLKEFLDTQRGNHRTNVSASNLAPIRRRVGAAVLDKGHQSSVNDLIRHSEKLKERYRGDSK